MEQKAHFLINHEWTSPALDWLMAVMSSMDVWLLPLGLLVLAIAWRGGFRARALLLCLAIGVGATDGLVCAPLKRLVARPRPADAFWDVRTVRLEKTTPRLLGAFSKPVVRLSAPVQLPRDGRSFPSSHVANNFCAAAIIVGFYRRWGWLAFVPATLVAWSRIYTGAHWPSDALVSAFLGVGIGCVVLATLELAWRRWGAFGFPTLAARHPSLAV